MRKTFKWIIVPLIVLSVVLVSSASATLDDKLHVYFLNVGQGDAILIRTPSHQNILIDGGPSPEQLNLCLGKHLPLWKHDIDLIISTQPHSDHIAGLVDVARRYNVSQVIGPDVDYDSSAYNEWRKLLQTSDIKYSTACAGQRISLDNDIHIDILNPQTNRIEGTSSDIDNNGVVLRLVYDDISFLFTADIRQETEQRLIDCGYELDANVLKIAHHGSNTSSSSRFIRAVSPDVAIISVGNGNKYGHPNAEVIETLDDPEVLRTDERGTIELISNGKKLWVKTEH